MRVIATFVSTCVIVVSGDVHCFGGGFARFSGRPQVIRYGASSEHSVSTAPRLPTHAHPRWRDVTNGDFHMADFGTHVYMNHGSGNVQCCGDNSRCEVGLPDVTTEFMSSASTSSLGTQI